MSQEKVVTISTSDGKTIYGKIIGDMSLPLVVLSHGLTDHMDSREMYNAAWVLADKGFCVFRFNYYDWQDNARDIADCTLETHAADLDTVVKHFRGQGSTNISVIGHSFGGLTVLLSREQDFDKAILWEPSHPSLNPFKSTVLIPGTNYYLMKAGVDYVFSKPMVESTGSLDIDTALSNFAVPTLLVSAGKGRLTPTNKQYFERLDVPKKFVEIKNADHGFANEGTFDELMQLTLDWLKEPK